MAEGLECVSVVDARMHLDKMSVAYWLWDHNQVIQEIYSLYNNEYP
jgi:hypothetical protein